MNPIIPGWYADPEIHFFGDRFYLYPTYSDKYDLQTFYDGFSSQDLVHWHKHPRMLDFKDVPWSTYRAAWAPSCAEKNGKYYLYFSAGDGAGLGVAVSDHPMGPFKDALGKPLVGHYPHGAQPIDAHCFIDDDGAAYLYFGGHRHAVVARLNDDMISLASEFTEITPAEYVEGPFMFKRRGVYYFMWSEGNWTNSSYGAAWGRSNSPFGPFKREGILLQNNPGVANGCGHHSVLQLPGTDRYCVAYHRRPLGETDENHRVVCLDELTFDADGSIAPVTITHCGICAKQPEVCGA